MGPEKTATSAREAFESQEFQRAFRLYVRAVSQLHDCYVMQDFATRRPSATDAWIVEGVSRSLVAARSRESEPDLIDVGDGVVEAARLLAGVAEAARAAGMDGTLYQRTLDDLIAAAGGKGPHGRAHPEGPLGS
jgi:hypothetical protein